MREEEGATELETIYREYKDKVYGYLISKLNNAVTAEDLCSEVFLKVTANIDRYDPEKAGISTWIYQITRNTLYDYYRTEHTFCELDESLAAEDDVSDKICNDEMLEELADALLSLPERECEIIVRHYYNGEKLTNIADRMDISYSYVKILHKSGIQKIKKYFENH